MKIGQWVAEELPPELRNVKPALGPLAPYGNKIAVAIGVVAFFVLCAILVQGYLGIQKMSVGRKRHNSAEAEEGQQQFMGALVKGFLVVTFGGLMSYVMVWASS